ncbi:hypothetical protein IFM46972_06522 [Aspergillus udagawae]|uniref:Uncharacterized protein n=1 Tax=Aspergillus udagawae TaxID=91492 RepID=A0A8H3NXF8_9EURO|nr:hypothetical protein IFM46972_06522 [Aspergillus udagawae]
MGIWGAVLNHSHHAPGIRRNVHRILEAGSHRDNSNRALCLLFVCFVFFASSAVFSLIVNPSNYSYIAFHHSHTAFTLH